MVSGKFGTAINCIDGRTQAPVSDWIKENHSVDYVDTITEPGCDKVLLEVDYDKIEHIKSKLLISIKAHNSSLIVIAGHYDCAGNPVSKEEHLTQIKKSIKLPTLYQLGLHHGAQKAARLTDEILHEALKHVEKDERKKIKKLAIEETDKFFRTIGV